MGSVMATNGRRLGRQKILTHRGVPVILMCTLFVLLFSARTISNWLSSFPNQALRISYGEGAYSSCVNFTDPLKLEHDSLGLLPEGEKYMWYSPHEGFSNQARELRNALTIAMLLNRTLILPPVVDHGEVKHGRCLKPRYSTQRKLKERSWSAVHKHIVGSRYVSVADIVDLRPLSPKLARTIDLRVFLALWCGLEIAPVCSGPKCWNLAHALHPSWGSIEICRQRLLPSSSGSSCLVYEVEDDCPTTIWTHGESGFTREFLEHQLMKKIRGDPEMSNKTSLIFADSGFERTIVRKDVVKALGPSSEAADYFLLSFGSLFSRTYKHMELHVDIRAAVGDRITATKVETIKGSHRFTKEIMTGAKALVDEKFAKRPYFCAHMRLGDGAFVKIWDKTLNPLKKKLEELSKKNRKNKKLHIFLMTDLVREKWNGTVLAEISNIDRYEVHTLSGHEDFVAHTAHQMMESEHGFSVGFIPSISGIEPAEKARVNSTSLHSFVPSLRLYLEEVICACATLGFLGTFRSTVTSNINDLRSAGLCPR